MEINVNSDLYHALRLLVAAVSSDWQVPFALEIARETLVNVEMLQDIEEKVNDELPTT